MRKELDEELVKDFPNIFRERYNSPQETCMFWGFPGDGWEPIIREACEKLKVLSDLTGVEFVAQQVKEKFGTLRFYFFSTATEDCKVSDADLAMVDSIAHDIVDCAEARSEYACEDCGKYGKLRNALVTLCDECYEHFKKEGTRPRRKTGVEDTEPE